MIRFHGVIWWHHRISSRSGWLCHLHCASPSLSCRAGNEDAVGSQKKKKQFLWAKCWSLERRKKYGLVLCYGSQYVFLCAHDPETLLSSDCGRLGKLGPHKILHSRSKKTAVFSCPESPALPQVHDFTTAPDARWWTFSVVSSPDSPCQRITVLSTVMSNNY